MTILKRKPPKKMLRYIRIIIKWNRRKLIRSTYIKKAREWGLFSLIPLIILGIDNRVKDYRNTQKNNIITELKAEKLVDKVLINILDDRISNEHMYIDDIEIAFWEKWKAGDEFVMIDLNVSAEELFKVTDRMFRGKTDADVGIYPKEFVDKWRKEDSVTVAEWRALRGVSSYINKDSSVTLLYMKKWPALRHRDTLVRAFAIPLDTLLTIINRKDTTRQTKITIENMDDSLN